MNLSFLPGDLHLKQDADGVFVVTMCGQKILVSHLRNVALAKFKTLRADLEKRFPQREPTAEEKAELLHQYINNSLLGHNSLGGRKKKTSAGGTRTFGG